MQASSKKIGLSKGVLVLFAFLACATMALFANFSTAQASNDEVTVTYKLEFSWAGDTAHWSDGSTADIAVTGQPGQTVPALTVTPECNGHIFVGWATSSTALNPNFFPGESVFPSTNTIVYDMWKAEQCTFTFVDELNGTTQEVTQAYDTYITQDQIPQPTSDIAIFISWDSNGESWEYNREGKISIPVRGAINQTFYAKWVKTQTPVVLGFAPGNLNGQDKMTYYLDPYTVINLADFYVATYEGYHQIGWADEYGNMVDNNFTVPASKIVLHAVWERDTNYDPAQTGWQWTEAGWVYVNEDGSLDTNEWAMIDGSWYYFGDNGVIYANCWAWIENAWYGFWSGGQMCTGWVWDSGYQAYFYCGPSGAMVYGVWAFIDGEWYGFWANGTMCTGWIWDSGYNAWFYCYNNGVMARNAWVDGYYLNASGICL